MKSHSSPLLAQNLLICSHQDLRSLHSLAEPRPYNDLVPQYGPCWCYVCTTDLTVSFNHASIISVWNKPQCATWDGEWEQTTVCYIGW